MVTSYRSPGQLGALVDGWRVLYVNERAASDGMGTIDRPYSDVQAALNAAESDPVVLIVAPGTYEGPHVTNSSVAIIGAGVGSTVLRNMQGPVLSAAGDADAQIVLGWLSIEGHSGMTFDAVGEVYALNIAVSADQGAALELKHVNTSAFIGASFEGAADTSSMNALIDIRGSGFGLFKSLFSNHGGPGLKAEFGDEDRACRLSPVCPFSNFIYLEDITRTSPIEGSRSNMLPLDSIVSL